MTKINKKLLVLLGVLVCSLCLCLGLAACNPNNGDNTNYDDSGGGHTHTFVGFWLFDGAEGHYRFATCHPEVQSEIEPHVDENGDFICDVCGYVMHVHVDEDGDNICDECQNEIHRHTFEDEWSFNEYKHWHEANCEHFIERSGYADHSFTQGVCECGVKESEVKVYDLYKNSTEYDLYFNEWLAWLAENGITVEYTASGDGIYHYEDGTSEVRFVGEREVKVKAECDGAPLADVWFMVTLYTNNEYYQINGTIALGLAKTDESGIAEITFRPVGGYSSDSIEYRIRLAERKDIAVLQGVDELQASLPFPNRYVVTGDGSGFEFVRCEVSEDATGDDIAATIEFTYSKSWNAYNTLELPYKRYYSDVLNATDLTESGKTYEFVTSGDNLFDYMLLFAAQYSFVGYTPEQTVTIENNAKIAASGKYKIYFTYEGEANVVLYSWNESNISFDNGAYTRKEDGTPADSYVDSISGGAAGENKYTGGNFIEFTIKPDWGLRNYQFGVISDTPVKVTLTVERLGDYVISYDPDFVFEVDENGNGRIENARFVSLTTDMYKDNGIVILGLGDMPAGTYVLDLILPSKVLPVNSGALYASYNGNSYHLFESTKSSLGIKNGYRTVITITDENSIIFIREYQVQYYNWTITLEKYEPLTVNSEVKTSVPVMPESFGETYWVPLDVAPGTYSVSLQTWGVNNGRYPITVCIGEKQFTLTATEIASQGGSTSYNSYEGTITVEEGDDMLALISTLAAANIADVKLTPQ